MEQTLSQKGGGKGLSGGALKMVAIVAMFIDHAAFLVSPIYYSPLGVALHFIGRLTGPLMFFFIVEGYHYTRNANRYTARLALFALISYLPFVLYFNNGLPQAPSGWLRLNVIYTLLLGLLALRARHEVKNPVLSVTLIGLCLACSVYGDWGFFAVIAILMMDFLRENRTALRAGFCLLALLYGVMPMFQSLIMGPAGAADLYLVAIILSLGMLVPMLLLGLYNGRRGKGGKWLFYIFYPAHLLVLWIMAQSLGLQVVA